MFKLNLLISLCVFLLVETIAFSPVSQAKIYVQPIVSLASGKYEEASYYEARAGAMFSFNDQYIRLESAIFHRFIDEFDNYSGLDLGLHIQRWFQLNSQTLLGTRVGPGYRWASNEWDALFLDFSVATKRVDLATFRLGYKLFFHEFKDSQRSNEGLIYLSVEL